MSDEDNASFIRWHGRTVQQLGFVNNLFIALSTGLFAFQMQLPFDDTALLTIADKSLFIASILSIAASTGIGAFTAWNRLCSFRSTMAAARIRERNPSSTRSPATQKKLDQERADYKKRDPRTWNLLRWQMITFGLGAFLLLILVLLQAVC